MSRIFNVSTDYLLGRTKDKEELVNLDEIDNMTLAFHRDGSDLSKEEKEMVYDFIQFVKSKRNKK